jgi:photosystem II stability/assembly factor-like uncharacterized protein
VWQTQQRVPTSSDLRAVIFANFGLGLVAGKDGTIFLTRDGGTSWLQEDFTPATRTGDIAALAGLGSRIVAVGSDALGAREWVTDDNLTWTTPDVNSSGAPYVDVNLNAAGVAAGQPVDVYRLRKDGTVDFNLRDGTGGSGGTGTWTNALGLANVYASVLPPTVPPFSFVCGDLGGAGQIIKVPVGACPVPASTTFRRVVLSPSGQPFACGDDTGNHGIVVYITNPDPTIPTPTWVAVPSNPGALPSFQALHFPDPSIGYVVGNGGTIYRLSFDGVSTWTWTNMNTGPVVTTENLYAVYFADKNHGWAVGDKGTVLRTTNGSASVGPWWTKVSSGTAGINWNALSFSDDGGNGIAVGNAAALNTAMIYRTIDGGAVWAAMPLPGGITTQNLNGVWVPRTSAAGTTAYICGDTGTLYRNVDVWGTGAWDNTGITGTTGTDTYRAVLFPQGGTKGVLIGNNGATPVLLRTANGLAWTGPTAGGFTSPTGSYNGLSSNPKGTTVYASGGNGKINVSTDLANGWLAWTDISPTTGLPAATLSSIQSPEGVFFKALVAASDGKVYRLTTGGASWSANFGTPWAAALPVSLGFDGIDALVVTNAGGLFSSTDGGANWAPSLPHTKAVPRTVWMSPTVFGLGYVGCDDGVILKTETGGH